MIIELKLIMPEDAAELRGIMETKRVSPKRLAKIVQTKLDADPQMTTDEKEFVRISESGIKALLNMKKDISLVGWRFLRTTLFELPDAPKRLERLEITELEHRAFLALKLTAPQFCQITRVYERKQELDSIEDYWKIVGQIRSRAITSAPEPAAERFKAVLAYSKTLSPADIDRALEEGKGLKQFGRRSVDQEAFSQARPSPI